MMIKTIDKINCDIGITNVEYRGLNKFGDSAIYQMYKEITFVYNNVTVGYFIPVIDSSSRPCFFDKVSMKCYYNHGTGEFLWGNR